MEEDEVVEDPDFDPFRYNPEEKDCLEYFDRLADKEGGV